MALNVKNLNTIKNVAKKSDEKSQILSLKIIDNENLIDYPRNNEDVTQTEDIQIAIRENGSNRSYRLWNGTGQIHDRIRT